MPKSKATFSAELRDAVRSSGLSLTVIARATDTDKMTVSRFINGKAGLSFESMDAIARFLDLHVTKGPGFSKAVTETPPKVLLKNPGKAKRPHKRN